MKNRKKTKFKKVYWLLAGLAAAFFVIPALLLYRPSRYKPLEVVPASPAPLKDGAGNKQGQVSPYLTHELLPQLYNGAQRQEQFDLIVLQKGINEVIARSEWPKEHEGIRFSAPEVLFVPEQIVLMGTAVMSGVELIITIVAEPALDHDGLLNLRVAKIKIGALNVTPLARLIAKKMYAKSIAAAYTDPADLRAQIAASLLNDEPFEPVFDVEDKKIRLKKITITQEKLMIRLAPASE